MCDREGFTGSPIGRFGRMEEYRAHEPRGDCMRHGLREISDSIFSQVRRDSGVRRCDRHGFSAFCVWVCVYL